MAKQTINNSETGSAVRAKINDNFSELYASGIDVGIKAGDSTFFTGQKSFRLAPILTDGVGQADFEIINLGNWNPSPQGTESRNLVPSGLSRQIGNIIMFRNLKWNNTSKVFEQYNTAADSYGASVFEAGGEGANMVHHPPGTQPSSHPVGLGFSVRGGGSRGEETDGVVTGYVNQSFAKIFMGFETSVSGLKYWANGASDPMLWIQTKEAKGTDNEMIALEANASSATVYGAHYFRKSRGTMESKTAVVADDITGRIGWKAYDGNSYEITAVIEAVAKGTVSDGNVGQNIRIRTSSTTVSGLNTLIECAYDNKLAFFNQTPVARQVVPTGSTSDQIITALQNLGLFSQT